MTHRPAGLHGSMPPEGDTYRGYDDYARDTGLDVAFMRRVGQMGLVGALAVCVTYRDPQRIRPRLRLCHSLHRPLSDDTPTLYGLWRVNAYLEGRTVYVWFVGPPRPRPGESALYPKGDLMDFHLLKTNMSSHACDWPRVSMQCPGTRCVTQTMEAAS